MLESRPKRTETRPHVDEDIKNAATERLAKVAGKTTGTNAEVETRTQAVRKLVEHMSAISGDPSGSDPSQYLSPLDTEICRQFVEIANGLGWPQSIEIDMRTARELGVPAWRSGKSIAKSGLQKALFFPKHHITHRGYIIGKLGINVPGTQPVALCDDGLLRSERGRELQRSAAFGWGKLPDIDLLVPTLVPGALEGVSYKNRSSSSLEDILMSNIPAAMLTAAAPPAAP